MTNKNNFKDYIRRATITLLLAVMTATTAWAGNEPIVNVEVCEGGAGYVHAKGWAYDPNNQDYSIDVVVYIYTDQNCAQSSGTYVYNANKERTDVNSARNITGNHGFEFDLPIDAGNYWLNFVFYNKDNTYNTILGPYPVTVTASQTGTVTLTPETGIVSLSDGSILTGTGGVNTRVSIASGATVTLSGVDITAIPDDYNHEWAGITCLGNATIVLAKGTDNIVRSGQSSYPGIQAGPSGTTLTIRGSGSLNVSSNETHYFGAGIGSVEVGSNCGNILIEGGNITAYGKYEPAIGGSHLASCGTITITGGTVYAESLYTGPGIGCVQSTCAGITITGGTVMAKSVEGPAIGSITHGNCNYITISGICSVTAESSNAANSIGTALNGTCGTITIGGVVTGNITQNPYTYAPTDIPYTVCFNANGGTGTMATQSFYSNTPQALSTNTFTRQDYVFIGWNTKADGSGNYYADGETVNNLGTVTLYAQWVTPDYVVSFDPNGGSGTMAGQNFAWDISQLLTANTFTRVGYDFTGWNTKADGSGDYYADGETVNNLGTVTFYAQWQILDYNITYTLDGGTNASSNPATYTVESDAITLAEPTRFGFIFDGWIWEGQTEPTKDVSIAHGSTGDKTYTAHWTFDPIATITPETGNALLYDGHTLKGTGGPDTHVIIKDRATVTLSDVNITNISDNSKHFWAGITCEGDATIILADETTSNLKGGYPSFPGISVPKDKTLTIQGNGTLYVSSNGYGPGIGPDGYGGGEGNITIEGGTIIAMGGKQDAGIGGVLYGSCGNITITDGVTSVTATAGAGVSYSIGSNGGTVTIGGIETGSIGMSPYTYKPSETTTCTVTFNANGGQGTMESQSLYSNIPRHLTANSFTLTDNAFIGWNTEADGSGTSYADGQAVMSTVNMTLFAQWHENFTVSYNANDGDGIMDSQNFIWNTPQALTANTFTRAGYDFTGWNTEADGSGTAYNDGQTVSNLGNTTLYAQWVAFLDMTLADNDDNSEIIGAKNGRTCRTLTLTGRTLYKDGDWNTLCLPFDMSETQIAASPLAGCILMELDGTTSNLTSGTLTLNFKNATSIEAGKPYIMKWITEVTDITSMPFFDLTDEEFNSLGFVGFTPLCLDGQDFSMEGSYYGPEKLVDGNVNSTYITSNANPWVEFYFDYAPITPKGYAIWTAKNNEGAYNPKSWTIKAQNYGESGWTTLVTVDNTDGDKLPMANSKRTVFALDNNRAFDTFRFEATKGSGFQLAELQFCTVQPSLSMQHNLPEPETITTDAEWETFADKVNSGTKTYRGAKVKLAADIKVSTMVGTSDHPFQGTFDGCGHTINVTIQNTGEQGTAPFRYISGATIMNVKTVGTVTGNLHCAGLVGFAWSGTNIIKNCEVAASVTCSGSHCGGILGHGKSSNTTITDCLFSGSITGATTATGIIYGWGDGGGTHSIINCLSAGTYTNCNGIELLRKDNGTEVITNCYRKTSGGTQGEDTNGMSASELAGNLGSGWEIVNDKVVPKKFSNDIVNPVFSGVTINAAAPTAVEFNITGSSNKCHFVGQYDPFVVPEANRYIMLGSGNTLGYAAAGKTLHPFRAHFEVPVGNGGGVKAYQISFGDEGTETGIISIDNGKLTMDNGAGAWYDLSGRKLGGKPTQKGIYIHNGIKVVIK